MFHRVFVGLCFVMLGLFSSAANLQAAASDTGTISHYGVRVDGLACPFCAFGLEKKIKRLPGTHNIRIDLEAGLLRFDVEGNQLLLPSKVKEAVKNAGFSHREITLRIEGKVEKSAKGYFMNLQNQITFWLTKGKSFKKLQAFYGKGQQTLAISGFFTQEKSSKGQLKNIFTVDMVQLPAKKQNGQ